MSTAPRTFADDILHHALTRPEKPAIILADRVATYAMMAQGMLRVEQRLRALALKRGELVSIAIENPIRHMIVAGALFRVGHPIISAVKPVDLAQHKLPIRTFLQSEPEALIPGVKQIVVGEDWFTGEAQPIPAMRVSGFADEQDVCRVDLSSGTTGRPKALSLSLQAFHQWTLNYYTAIGLGTWDRLVCLPGLNSSWGFTMAAHCLMAGRTMLRAVGPREALHLISVYGADALVASSQQLRDVVRQQSQAPVPCPTLRTIMTGGGLISHHLMTRSAREAVLDDRHSIRIERSGFYRLCTRRPDRWRGGRHRLCRTGSGGAGYRRDGKPLPADTEGILRVRAPWLAQPFSREAGKRSARHSRRLVLSGRPRPAARRRAAHPDRPHLRDHQRGRTKACTRGDRGDRASAIPTLPKPPPSARWPPPVLRTSISPSCRGRRSPSSS